ncbi:MAG: response regulator transcription factor [Deltaproteobacteria bacterium]|nr:response regulator transcription factor [Deltaproteobacteria bacterium]
MPDVLVAISDLMFQSKVDATARAVGVMPGRARRGSTLWADVRETGARRVIIDLTSPAFGGVEAVRALRKELGMDVEVVGYCRHTHEELIASARAAGCNAVLTQGQLSDQLADLLASRPLA